MKTLFLLRHAKSSWSDSGLPDFERPLNKRGRKTAPLMGRFIAERGLTPDCIVSSTALRAQQTAEAVAEHCGFGGEIISTGDLYPTSPGRCFEVLLTMPDEAGSVMLVGHNPGIEEFLSHLTDYYEAIQTCVLSQIELDIDDWTDLAPETRGRLIEVFRPRELFDDG